MYTTEEKTTEKQTSVEKNTSLNDTITILKNIVEQTKDPQIIKTLIDLQKEIYYQEAKKSFYNALIGLQSKMPVIPKDKSIANGYKYASYDIIVKTIQPYLQEFGFCYRFETEFEPKAVIVSCILSHKDGHSEVTKFKAPIDTTMQAKEIQKWGTSLTYAKRYSLSLALGFATEEDTDATDEQDTQCKFENKEIPVYYEKDNTEISESIEEFPVDEILSTEYTNAEQLPKTKQQITENTENTKNTEKIEKATENQIRAIYALLNNLYPIKTKEEKIQILSSIIGRKINSIEEISKKEASLSIETLKSELEPF